MPALPRFSRLPSLLVSALVALAALPAGWSAPARILFMRHAEKPAEGPELNARGRQRAAALPGLFMKDPRILALGGPVALYACSPEKPGSSVRSIETLEPLGHALHLPLITRYRRDDVREVAAAILANRSLSGQTIVVCWEHKRIPDIIAALGWTSGPKTWPDVFDQVWALDFDASGHPVRLRMLDEHLLPGDAPN